MTRSEVVMLLAVAVDAESATGFSWWPGTEMAPIAFRRWSSFERRHKAKYVTTEVRVMDLAKGLQAHFEPTRLYTPMTDWLSLARSLSKVFISLES